jgi:hypothetical protein
LIGSKESSQRALLSLSMSKDLVDRFTWIKNSEMVAWEMHLKSNDSRMQVTNREL